MWKKKLTIINTLKLNKWYNQIDATVENSIESLLEKFFL